MKKVTLTILLIATLILTCFAFTSCGKEYTVTWQNWDGTVLEVDNVKEETTPTYDGVTPTKEGNEQYAYEFSGWDKEIRAVTGNTVYVALFNEILLTYPIVWQNWDGTILEQRNENYGAFPSYSGETPVKEATAEYTYTFSGWSPTVDIVTGGITYVAQFTAETRKYSVTWKNWEGSVLEVDEFAYGEYPTFYGTPTKGGDAEFSYYFSGWAPSVDIVTENVTYTAEFQSYKNTYYVTWKNWNGNFLTQSEYEYGTIPEYPDSLEEPTRYSDEQYIYTFAGWSPTIDVVTGHITYVAQYSTELQKYTVTWKNWDGTTLETDENVEYGTMPTYDGETPVREPFLDKVYIFSGWSPSVDAVTGNVTYYAQFTSETAKYTVTWTNWDGTVLEVDEGVPHGTKPTYDGKTPSKADDIEYTYTFSGWSPYVTGYLKEDVTYVAWFTSEYRRYKVTWKNWDGSVLRVDEVEYGRTPSYRGETPTKPCTDTEAFDFVGWDKPQTSVEGEQTYIAVFDDVRIYQVKYNLDGGSASDIENTYKRVNKTYFLTNVIPTKAGYRFVGWNNVHESSVYAPGEYFYGNFDVEFYALWERYELCSTCEGNGYLTESCSACDGKGEWYTTCTGGFTLNGTHCEGTICPNCNTDSGFRVINGIGKICESCYIKYGVYYRATNIRCTRCSGSGKIYHTCDSCNILGYITVTCPSCDGSKGIFEESPSVSYKTTSKVELVYIEGYEYSRDGLNWQASPLFEKLSMNTQYTFYQRRASTQTVPFGPTSTALVVKTDDYYSVTYELNGGSSNSNPERYKDNVETVLKDPRKTGYTFLGWYDADGNKIETIGNGMYGDLVLYAKWNDGNLYTVSFNVNGGNSEIEPITVQFGKEYTLPTPVRSGYKFKYWYATGNTPSPSIQGTWTIAQDVELTANWEVIYYNISYGLNGGSYEHGEGRYQYTFETETFTLNYPKKTGYTFIGWTYEGQDTPVLDLTIVKGSTGDLQLTAHWTGNTYTITLDANGGEVEDTTFEVIYGEAYTLPTPTRAGYTFVCWYNGNVSYSSGTWNKAENFELVAEWKANTYKITLNDTEAHDITVFFDYQYSSHANHKVTFANGNILDRPENPKRENFVFTGWYTDVACTTRFEFTGTIDDNITLYAGWLPMSGAYAYSQIQIDPANYTSSSSPYSAYVATNYYGSVSYITYLYMVAEETGAHSIYWKNNSTSYSYYFSVDNLTTQASIVTETLVNTANYQSCTFSCSKGDIIVIKLFASTYSSNVSLYFDGFGKPASDCVATPRCEYEAQSTYKYSVVYDKNGWLPTPIRPHYTFLGWYNGEEKVESGDWKIAGDTVLVPKWELSEYGIIYNLDGGTNAISNPSYYTQDDEIILAPPTKPGYEFLGWTGSNGDVPELVVRFSGEDFIEREYTAHWEVAIYNVEYVLNGGTNPSKNPSVITIFDNFELKAPSKTGYSFDSWYLDDEFTLPIISLTNITSDITLYARFIPNQYGATFVDDSSTGAFNSVVLSFKDGVNSIADITLKDGEAYNPYLIIPTKSGYIFEGWYLGSTKILGSIVIEEDTVLKAKWISQRDYLTTNTSCTNRYDSSTTTTYLIVPSNCNKIYVTLYATYYNNSYIDASGRYYGTWYSGGASIKNQTSGAEGLSVFANMTTPSHTGQVVTLREENEGYLTVNPGDILCLSATGYFAGVTVQFVGYQTAAITNEPKERHVTFNYDDEFSLVAPEVSRRGYEFVGWMDEEGNIASIKWNYTSEQTFTAKWALIDYTIEYVLDGGTNSLLNPGHYDVTQSINLADATKEGYTFGGWYLDSGFTQNLTSINQTTGDYTLYAKFTPNTYNATLDLDGGIVAPTVTFVSDGEIVDSYYLTADISMESYYPSAKEGYIFGGWYLDEDYETVFDLSAVITEDTTLYAKWISSDVTCHRITSNEVETESIVINGTSEIMITFVPLASGEITISTVSQLDVKGILYDQNMVIVAEADDISDEDYNFSITYYVQAGKQYTIAIRGATTLTKGDCNVSFSFDGSMGISGTTYTSFAFDVVYDSSFELPIPTKEGYEFLGWFDSDGNAVTSSTWNYAQDTTLYAHWSAID